MLIHTWSPTATRTLIDLVNSLPAEGALVKISRR
jgi:hypothetical protein